MTSAPSDLQIGSLAPAARELHERHTAAPPPARQIPSRARLVEMEDWLEHALSACSDPPPAASKAAEWLLDNDYLVQRAVVRIQKDLPPGFYARLPALAGESGRQLPRIYAVAHGMLQATRLQFSLPAAVQYTNAYQEGDPLRIAELWAFPTMVRLACLEVLTNAFDLLYAGLEAPLPLSLDETALDSLEHTECVARAVANLGLVDSIAWKDFFRQTSRVEAILRGDPAAVYEQMDDPTRDRYRRVVEELGHGAALAEAEVAERVVARAQSAGEEGDRRRHVGFWLVDVGRVELESELGYHPGWRLVAERWLYRHAVLLHVLVLLGATAAALWLPAFLLQSAGASLLHWAIGALVVLLPASVVAITIVHWAITRLAPPRVLPKLDLDHGIPAEFATAVVMPVLLGSRRETEALLDRLEGHYLTNPDPSLRFALLADFTDAPVEHMPGDPELLRTASEGVRRLNDRYGTGGEGPFHLLHRPRRYNPAEGSWMAWERKRGKLEEFNELIATGQDAGFTVQVGNSGALRRVRFVVTLDADTQILSGTLARLIGTLAHPLHRAEFDERTGRIRFGYSIVQPRVEIAPESGSRSLFARICSGDTAIDIYTRAVSNVYHDLFGVGIFVGKGIYDVAAFRRSLEGRIPENAILSHDLFEGIHGRVGLASDIVFFEGFPSGYPEFAWRWHRWVRGDWALLPWLGRRVPARDGRRIPNPLSGFARWLILDNLRRSLLPPALLLLFAAGWLVLPGSPWLWTTLGVLAPGAYLITDLVAGLTRVRGRRRGTVGGVFRRVTEHAGRWAVALAFLPQDSWIALDAIVRAVWRVRRSHRHLLEWTSAAHMAARFASQASRWNMWRELAVGPLVAALLTVALVAWRPHSLWPAIPLLVLWYASPEIAYWLGRPRARRIEQLEPSERSYLRRVARRTWLFFETFVGPDDHWLPPDNFQEEPGGDVAHRTSPTNVGMMLLGSLTAWDLGYLSVLEFGARLQNVLDSMDRLPRYRGHWLNWYDTRTRAPLPPRYVSTVDSGNLAVSLLAVAEGCREIAAGPAFPSQAWDGLADELELLGGTLEPLSPDVAKPILARLASLAARAREARHGPRAWRSVFAEFRERELPETDRLLLLALEDGSPPSSETMREIRVWQERVQHHLHAMQRDQEWLLPWGSVLESPAAGCQGAAQQITALLPPTVPLHQVAERTARAHQIVHESRGTANEAASDWFTQLEAALDIGAGRVAELLNSLLAAAARAESAAWAMDFRLLFESTSRLFYIGYHVDADRMDLHRYDLLASEARLASFLAIAKRDVPMEHWFHLGRPIRRAPGGVVLASWSGSMFEYLMPPLLLRSHDGTLLGQSERSAVESQRRHAKRFGIPWGMSESSYASLNQERQYRYRAFGVPDLGLRRGLSRDLVVAPYATFLAVALRPTVAIENLRELEKLGLVGRYGFYEAADFTPRRVPAGERCRRVRSYMAHHQGMILAAIGNAVGDGAIVRRFHADRRVRVAELLLQERVPREIPPEAPRTKEREGPPPRAAAPPSLRAWAPRVRAACPEWHLLGNGRLTTRISEAGGSALHWHEQALTRWLPDATRDAHGMWIYIRDEETGAVWSATRQPRGSLPVESNVIFHPHLAEFHRRDGSFAVGMEVGIPPGDDVEIRTLTVDNETDRARWITITTYGEVVLAPGLTDERHPGFNKLFVGSEYLPALRGLLFTRRPKGPEERPPVLLHRLVTDDPRLPGLGYETDRRRFLGRNRDTRRPAALEGELSQTVGWTLDPILSLQVRLRLAPRERRRLAFTTLAAGSRESVLELAGRYATISSLEWALADAAAEAAREVQRLGLDPARLPELQRLTSLLVNPHPALRSSAAAANQLGQPRLWRMGLSGDWPILLLRAGDPTVSELLQLLLRGHEMWRRRGLKSDLVVLRTGASGYIEPLRERLLALLQEAGMHDVMGSPGGVHYLLADQLAEDERCLLDSCAHAVLDDTRGSLAEQLETAPSPPAELPAFQPAGRSTPEEETPPLERPSDLLFDNGWGGFSADGKEYVIHLEPGETTPGPWANVLAGEAFGTLVTEAGLGWTWAGNSAENRLTPWSGDPLGDPASEALYLRDEETAIVWTPTPGPAGEDAACEIRHGAGYTTWRKRSHGLEQTLRVFVPPDDPVKVVELRLQNLWRTPRRLTVTYYAEWLLGSLQSVSRHWVECEYEPDPGALLARSPWNPDFAERTAFLASSLPPHGLTADRQEFLGREGDLRRPAGLLRWGLSDRVPPAADPCAALQVHLTLEPDQSADLRFVLGQGKDRAHAVELAGRWRDRGRVARGFEELRALWDRRLGCLQVKTPDPAFDLLTNRWLLYQALSSRILARTGLHQPGGAFGFRDQIQDHMALLFAEPARARAHLLACASHQFEEGDVLHWWHPPGDRGVRTRCSDDLLWLPYCVAHYVEATGDESILDVEIPFLRGAPLATGETDRYAAFEASPERRSLFEHCERALERGVTRGEHGLPLIGTGDWNDGMNRVGPLGRGESVWLAWFTIAVLDGFVRLAKRRGRDDLASRWHDRAREMASAVEATAWDGAWYVRAFDDAGRPWGSAAGDECRLDSLSQSWAVLSGAADPERARQGMEAVWRNLRADDVGVLRILDPPLDATPRDPGYIKAYPPGVRENAGQYQHAAAWVGWAFALRRDGERAFAVHRLLTPVHRTATPEGAEHYRGEPYVVAGDIGGHGSHAARAGWTWYTGSASWTWRLGVERILGLRLEGGRLVVDPCLPPGWSGYEAEVRGPAGSIRVRVEDGAAPDAGGAELQVDGAAHPGSAVDFPTDGSTRTVELQVARTPTAS